MAAAVRECLELQLLEVEMLLSMFPKKGEISLDGAAVPALQRYLRDGGGSLPPRLEYSVAVGVGEPEVRAAPGRVRTPALLVVRVLNVCPKGGSGGWGRGGINLLCQKLSDKTAPCAEKLWSLLCR